MKFILKLLLFLCLVFVGIYATTPWWLPYALERQLPPGWQLESMEAGYPGLSGIDIHSLRLRGALMATDLGIAATDLRIEYRSREIEVDSISLRVYLAAGVRPSISAGLNALVFNLASFRLTPRTEGGYHISTDAALEGFPQAAGHIEADAGSDLLEADIRFPVEQSSPSWLTMHLEQKSLAADTNTRIQAVVDTEPANQEWVDWLLVQITDGVLTRVKGRLEVDASLNGSGLEDIENLSLKTQNLEMVSSSGPLSLKAGLVAHRDRGDIVVKLSSPAEIQFEDQAGVIDQLLTNTLAGIQRAPRTDAVAFLRLASTSQFVIKPGASPSIGYEGALSVELAATGETIHVESDKLTARMKEFPNWATLASDGLFKFDWQESAGLAYRSEDLELRAEELSATGEIISRKGAYTGKGSGTLTAVEITQPAITAETVEMEWQDLDLLKLTGRLSTRTRGLSAGIGDETWTGFDLDADYRLIDGTDIKGRGKLMFDDGPNLPIMFSGNSDTHKWDITLRRVTVDMPQLTNILGVAHIELPDPVRLTDGRIALQGQVTVDEDITARMDIEGSDIDASLRKSHADDARFSFSATYDDTISAIGPVSVESVGLAGGIEVTDIRTDLQVTDTGNWRLEKLSAKLFEGQIRLNRLRYANDMLEDTILELNDINLGRLLEYADFDGLRGSGLLHMSLPISADETGINIKDGLFRSTVPGYLAYAKEGVAGSNIGMQALENFRYKDLSGEINYQSDGSYLVKIHLEGNNPDLYEGHPVDFNLNIDGSLPKLFETLFITGDFEEAILEEIRSH